MLSECTWVTMRWWFQAYKRWANEHSTNPDPILPNVKYTSEQLFFISTAQIWCSKYKIEALQNNVLTDVHSLPEFRQVIFLSKVLQKCLILRPLQTEWKEWFTIPKTSTRPSNATRIQTISAPFGESKLGSFFFKYNIYFDKEYFSFNIHFSSLFIF